MKKKNILITGPPGVGKTTLIKKLSEELKHFHPVGFYTTEIREEGIRKGFELISLEGRRGLLSHIHLRSPYRVGQYKVDIKGFEDFLDSIPFLSPSTHLIVMDEIGKMECFSDQFKKLLKVILDSEKLVIATIALKGNGLIAEIKKRYDIKLYEMIQSNRDSLFPDILKEVIPKNSPPLVGGDEGEGVLYPGVFNQKIEVIAYSGYRGEETPRIMILHGKKIEVAGILSMWIEEGLKDRARKRFFKVKGSDGSLHQIYYNEKSMEWFYIIED